MTEPAHYSHGPSGAHRWLICTDSPYAEADYPDSTTDAADEGTAAHWLLEQCLTTGLDAQEWVNKNPLGLEGDVAVKAGEETGCLKDWPITGEMIEAVQLAIDNVKADAEKRGTKSLFEERVRLDKSIGLPEPVGGTADILQYLPRSKTLKVKDFKYGRGLVEVADPKWKVNPQLGLYALATLAELERLFGKSLEVKWIELTIIQPRVYHPKGPVRTTKISPTQLMDLEMGILEAFSERKRVAGDHCHFCRAKPDCETHHAWRHANATDGFDGENPLAEPEAEDGEWAEGHQDRLPVTINEAPMEAGIIARPVKGLTLQELAQARKFAAYARKWAQEIEEEVKVRLLNDLQVPGAKLVQGRGSRNYGGSPDDVAAATLATAEALDIEYQDLHTQPALKSPAQLEKELGRAKFRGTPLAKLVVHKEGGPVVADEDDDRQEWSKSDAFEAEAPEPDEVKSALL